MVIILKEVIPQNAIMNTIGKRVLLCKRLIIPDIIVPQTIWMKPISADAVPALFSKVINASAVVLGTINPDINRKAKSAIMRILASIIPRANPSKSATAISKRYRDAIVMILKEVYFSSRNLFNWLPSMYPNAFTPNMIPNCDSLKLKYFMNTKGALLI